jgi:hypothetical protein
VQALATGADTRHGWLGIGVVELAPLRIRLFRTLWIAALAGNVGDWMQTVGAQWLLVHGPHAAVLVPLVQTANALPAVHGRPGGLWSGKPMAPLRGVFR